MGGCTLLALCSCIHVSTIGASALTLIDVNRRGEHRASGRHDLAARRTQWDESFEAWIETLHSLC